MCAIFLAWGGVQQSSLSWTANPYFEAFQKPALTFQSGKPLSGHPQDDKPFKTITRHLK